MKIVKNKKSAPGMALILGRFLATN